MGDARVNLSPKGVDGLYPLGVALDLLAQRDLPLLAELEGAGPLLLALAVLLLEEDLVLELLVFLVPLDPLQLLLVALQRFLYLQVPALLDARVVLNEAQHLV